MGRKQTFPVLRGRFALVAAIALIGSLTVPGSLSHALADSPTVPPPIDLTNPTATINDPAASLPYVNTECATGQVDINTASAAAIGTAFKLPSVPTVSRLIAMRPWLKGSDLSSVPGIGPPLAAQMAPKVCASQSTPPPGQLACTSSTQIDLQTATAPTISSRLWLPLVTANALVAARPLPQDIDQLVAPRIPGFAGPTADALIANGLACITPPPMYAGGTAYRWATPTGGTVVTRNGFSLIVPPGRTTGGGAYAGVTPMAPDSGILPQADFEIYGTWNQGSTTVAVQGPYIAPGASGGPVVLHNASDGERISIGSGAVLSTINGVSTVTAAETSLSPSVFGYTPCANLPSATFSHNPACLKSLSDGSLAQAWQNDASGSAQDASLPNQPSLADALHCQNTGTGTVVSGSLPYGMDCQSSFDPNTGDATWTMTNKAYVDAAYGLLSGQVVYNYSTSGGQYTNPPALTGPADSNVIMNLIDSYAAPNLRFILGGKTLNITKTQGFLTTTVNVNSNPIATAVWNGLSSVLAVVGPKAGLLNTVLNDQGKVSTFTGCLTNLTTDSLGCLKGIIQQVSDYLKTPQGAAKFGLATTDQALYATASTFFKWLDAAAWAGSFIASIVFQHIGGTGVVLANQPPAPTADAEGRAIDSTCLSHNDTSWTVDENCQSLVYAKGSTPVPGSGGGTTGLDAGIIVRDPVGHAYFADQTSMTISPINTGDLYLCLANHYIVDWNYDPLAPGNARYAAFTSTSTQASCDPSAAPTAAVTQPNNVTPLYTVLREPDGTAWVVDGTTTNEMRVSIPNGTEFNCWVSPNPSWPVIEFNVWDQVTPAELANYPVDPNVTFISNCFPPTF